MAIKTIRILKGPSTARLMCEAGRILDPNMPGGDITFTLEYVGLPMFDGKSFPVDLTEIKAIRENIEIAGWMKVPGGSRRFTGIYNGHRPGSNDSRFSHTGYLGLIEIEVD